MIQVKLDTEILHFCAFFDNKWGPIYHLTHIMYREFSSCKKLDKKNSNLSASYAGIIINYTLIMNYTCIIVQRFVTMCLNIRVAAEAISRCILASCGKIRPRCFLLSCMTYRQMTSTQNWSHWGQLIDKTTTKISKDKQLKQRTEAEVTKESVCNHLQLVSIQTTFSGREKLPAQHLSKLGPSGCGTVGKEHDVLGKQMHH